MPYISSSPLAYPPSSPVTCPSPKKRRKTIDTREPLHDLPPNQSTNVIAGFLINEDDDDDDVQSDEETMLGRRVVKPLLRDDFQTIEDALSDIQPASQTTLDLDRLEDASQDVSEHTVLPATSHMQNSLPVLNRLLVRNSSGKTTSIRRKPRVSRQSYEQIVAARSSTAAGRATRGYYGIDVHELIQEAETAKLTSQNAPVPTAWPSREETVGNDRKKTLLWTEKYRAKKFTDLVGDERTHRSVLKWLKGWDPVVFPHHARPKAKKKFTTSFAEEAEHEYVHRKVLLLTGPPGLGKTTLAHVCARQAGYEVQEINASDERSKDVVNGRIKDMVGTENVRNLDQSKAKKAARPMCVVVDEVDGVVGGSGGGGEGGFIKALLELLNIDQRNTRSHSNQSVTTTKKRKGDNFRFQRPLILICNDVYHPSLRLLRQGSLVEVIHIRKPPINMIIPRLQAIFEKEGVACDSDGVRQLCEATWGVTSRKESASGDATAEGDMRGILVIGEWVAGKLLDAQRRSAEPVRLTRRWIEQNILGDLAHGGGAARSLGRGGSRETVERVFRHNAGFSSTSASHAKSRDLTTALTSSETAKSQAIERLRSMIASSGDDDRIMTDCFSAYLHQPFQDDTVLSKPCAAADWLHLHDTISSRVHSSQEWELAPYLAHPILAFHTLFATATPNSITTTNTNHSTTQSSLSTTTEPDPHPLTTPRAPAHATDLLRSSTSTLSTLHTNLSLPLQRSFRAHADLATELLPYVIRILSPDIRPVVVGGRGEAGIASVRRAGERELVDRAVACMVATGVQFERSRIEVGGEGLSSGQGYSQNQPQTFGQQGWVFRMEPGVDELVTFETADGGGDGGTKVRFAVRQVLQQAWEREVKRLEGEARTRRFEEGGAIGLQAEGSSSKVNGDKSVGVGNGGGNGGLGIPAAEKKVKRDFFGRKIEIVEGIGGAEGKVEKEAREREERIWFTFHEGFSNAVRKGITMKELMDGF